MLKYNLYVFLFFILCVLSINLVNASKNNKKLRNKIIYLDAGHGGRDSGAYYSNVYEKDINLQISKKLEKALKKEGATIYQTRYGDYDLSLPNSINKKRHDLSRRSILINESNADLFISIHLNAEPTGSYKGPQVFYNSKLEENKKLASLYQEILNKDLNGNRKYKKDNTLYLQKRLNVPGILIEAGFISNRDERYLLKQKWYQKKIVNSIVNATLHYFSKKY